MDPDVAACLFPAQSRLRGRGGEKALPYLLGVLAGLYRPRGGIGLSCRGAAGSCRSGDFGCVLRKFPATGRSCTGFSSSSPSSSSFGRADREYLEMNFRVESNIGLG